MIFEVNHTVSKFTIYTVITRRRAFPSSFPFEVLTREPPGNHVKHHLTPATVQLYVFNKGNPAGRGSVGGGQVATVDE